jgi:hypothetical protein
VKTVVDGQQRVVTLSLLANSIRKAAERLDRKLVGDSLRDVFLYAVDYEQDSRVPRVDFASERDRAALTGALGGGSDGSARNANKTLLDAQTYLDARLDEDLKEGGAQLLGRWAHFLSNGITFAIFEHPDRNAAYKVFEIVNTRGKDLTPAELIKSFVIGSSAPERQSNAHERWLRLEEPFVDAPPDSQLTQFIRNIVTLRHGYVEPRDLYDAISTHYAGGDGVDRLLDELEDEAPQYLHILNPPLDSADPAARSFAVLKALGLRTVRPVFVAMAHADNADTGFRELFRIIVPRLVVGNFGTGSVERRFAEAARTIFKDRRWGKALSGLADLRPSRELFEERLATRPQNRGVLLVVRAGALQGAAIPDVDGYVHQVRPRNAEEWPDFSDQDFSEIGGTVGNAIICMVERRPRNTNSLSGAMERLIPHLAQFEDASIRDATTWSADLVRKSNTKLASRAAAAWYE